MYTSSIVTQIHQYKSHTDTHTPHRTHTHTYTHTRIHTYTHTPVYQLYSQNRRAFTADLNEGVDSEFRIVLERLFQTVSAQARWR